MSLDLPQTKSDSSRCDGSPNSSIAGTDQLGSERLSFDFGSTPSASVVPVGEKSLPVQLSFSDCETSSPSSPPGVAATAEQLEISLAPVGKRCYSCLRLLPLENFARIRDRQRPGVEFYNRRCNSCRSKRAEGTPAIRRRMLLVSKAKNVPCHDCGNRFPEECMDFDHVRGEKLFTVGSCVRWKPDDVLQAEIDKCDVVCSNCHRIRTRRTVRNRTCQHRIGRPPRHLAELPPDADEIKPGHRSMELLAAWRSRT